MSSRTINRSANTESVCEKCFNNKQSGIPSKLLRLSYSSVRVRMPHKLKWSYPSVFILFSVLLFSFTNLATCSPPLTLSAQTTKASEIQNSRTFFKSDQKNIPEDDEMQATQAVSCAPIEPPYLKTEEKIVLSPIVFQGQLNTKSTVLNSVYHVTFRVYKIYKGKLPTKQHRHVRLVFQTELSSSSARKRVEHDFDVDEEDDDDDFEAKHETRQKRGKFFFNSSVDLSQNRSRRSVVLPACTPVRFNVQAGKKYLIYMKKITQGRYVPFALPDDYTKRARRLLKKYSCSTCSMPPKVSELRPTLTVSEGTNVKFKCKLSGIPSPTVTWHKNGIPLKQDFRFSIKSKKKRSQLRITDVHRRDTGKYTCSAKNILGEDSQTSSLIVRYTAPDPPPSSCPIESFCLNEGKCFYYEMIGELVCKCTEGYAGQRCQFKKARINLPLESDACGPYGHDIHLREICAAWKRPPVTEMSREEYDDWLRVEQQLAYLRKQKELEQMEKFRKMSSKRNSSEFGQDSQTSTLSQDNFVEEPADTEHSAV